MNQSFSVPFQHPFKPDKNFSKSVAYFSMEFALDQALKSYSGGLGFLAGSHMKSVYSLRQNLIGVGMLWKYGYYDQGRKGDGSMQPEFHEKMYHFLQDTGIRYQIPMLGKQVWVAAYYLEPQKMFRITLTAPLINKAEKIVVVAFGEKKAPALKEVTKGEYNPSLYPMQLIKPVSGELLFLVDKSAAGTN